MSKIDRTKDTLKDVYNKWVLRIGGIKKSEIHNLQIKLGAIPFYTTYAASEPQETKALHFLIDPGSASSNEIAELYHEISKLYIMIGGSGIEFRTLNVMEEAGVHV
jgi:hypothetical protein